MISVFICAPYGDHNPKDVRLNNTKDAIDAFLQLLDAGLQPFCPHLSHFVHELSPRPRLRWLAHGLHWLEKCDCVLVLGKETEGMRAEITRAHILGKPVFRSCAELGAAYGVTI